MNTSEYKEKIRKEALKFTLSSEHQQRIIDAIIESPLFRQANSVLLYLSMSHEIDSAPLIQAAWKTGKVVTIPFIDWQNKSMCASIYTPTTRLIQGKMMLRSPILCELVEQIDLAIVPSRILSLEGTRIGTGGGYYDRYFAAQHVPIRIGISLQTDWPQNIPHEAYDIPMTHIIVGGDLQKADPILHSRHSSIQ